jgi:hypothetical protein
MLLIINTKETKSNNKKRNLKGLLIRGSLVRAQEGEQKAESLYSNVRAFLVHQFSIPLFA